MGLPKFKILIITDRKEYWIEEVKKNYGANSALSLSNFENYSMIFGDCVQIYLIENYEKITIENNNHVTILDKKVSAQEYEENIAPYNTLSKLYFGEEGEIQYA